MNKNAFLAGASAALFMLCTAGPAISASASGSTMAAPTPARVNFCGTVQRVDPHSCLLVSPSEPIGHAFDITGVNPEPNIGTQIAGSGVSAGSSSCKGAARLTEVKWTPGAICPLVKKK